jgi:chemotaxis protein MotB
MASTARGKNEPEPKPIIIKKVIEAGHGAHHGGAWKVAYADFVTAMMAFFLLLWLLGATDEAQRKGIADYFTPTLVEHKTNGAGSDGFFGGDSIVSADTFPHKAAGVGTRSVTIPKDATGGPKEASESKGKDRERFKELKKTLMQRMMSEPSLSKLKEHVRFTETTEGLRIDLVDEADFSMFKVGTDALVPEARRLVGEVAKVIQGVPNSLILRGHTDGLPYSKGQTMNNWLLSSARAESTRAALAIAGVPQNRFAKIEGVADRDPYVKDRYDPRNRRMAIILAWSTPAEEMAARAAAGR